MLGGPKKKPDNQEKKEFKEFGRLLVQKKKNARGGVGGKKAIMVAGRVVQSSLEKRQLWDFPRGNTTS